MPVPFNGSGVFSILNSFSPNTTILSSAVNANFTDIASGLSDVLTRDGQAGMTATLKVIQGLGSTPSMSFTADTTSGVYQPATHEVGLSANGYGFILNGASFAVSGTPTVNAGGSTYVVGDLIYGPTANAIRPFVLAVATLSGNAVATVTVTDAGLYTVDPAGSAVAQSSSSGSGTGATFGVATTNAETITTIASARSFIPMGMSSYMDGIMQSPTLGALQTTLQISPQLGSNNPFFGFTEAVNLQLYASVSSNNLKIAIKANNGADPTSSNPVAIPFRDPTIGNGDPVWVNVTAATSITANAGATFGVAANNTPFRLWITGVYKSSTTVQLGLMNCSISTSTASTIYPLYEDSLYSSTLVSSTATVAGTLYTGSSVASSEPIRILGYAEWNAGLATNGSYSTSPTRLQIFGPATKRPGDVINYTTAITGSVATTANTYTISDTAPTASVGGLITSISYTPNSSVNILNFSSQALLANNSAAAQETTWLASGAAGSVTAAVTTMETAGTNDIVTVPLTYRTLASGTTTTFNGTSGSRNFGGLAQTFLKIEEIQG